MAELARNSAPGAVPPANVVKYSSWSTPIAHTPASAAAFDAAGTGLATGAEDDVGALADELGGVGRALGGSVKLSL